MTTALPVPTITNSDFVAFDAKEHKYTDTLTGTELTNVSRVRDSFKVPFDADYWAPRKAAERGVDTAVILKEWEDKKNEATARGNLVHTYISDVLTAAYTPDFLDVLAHIPELPEQRAWRQWYITTMQVRGIIQPYPAGVEVIIGDRELGIAGTIDAIFTTSDGTLEVWDWKTGSKFETINKWNKYLLSPFNFLDECELSTYTLQVALYTLLLRRAGHDIRDATILHLGKHGPDGHWRGHNVGGATFETVIALLERHLLEAKEKGLPIA